MNNTVQAERNALLTRRRRAARLWRFPSLLTLVCSFLILHFTFLTPSAPAANEVLVVKRPTDGQLRESTQKLSFLVVVDEDTGIVTVDEVVITTATISTSFITSATITNLFVDNATITTGTIANIFADHGDLSGLEDDDHPQYDGPPANTISVGLDASADYDNLPDAIAAASASSSTDPYTIHVAAGLYSGQVVVPYPYIAITGDRGAHLYYANATNGPTGATVQITANYVKVQGITIENPGIAGAGGVCVGMSSVYTNAQVLNCHLIGYQDTVWNGGSMYLYNNFIEGNFDVITMASNSTSYIIDNIVFADGNNAPLWFSGSGTIYIHGNHLRSGARAMKIADGATNILYWSDNYIYGGAASNAAMVDLIGAYTGDIYVDQSNGTQWPESVTTFNEIQDLNASDDISAGDQLTVSGNANFGGTGTFVGTVEINDDTTINGNILLDGGIDQSAGAASDQLYWVGRIRASADDPEHLIEALNTDLGTNGAHLTINVESVDGDNAPSGGAALRIEMTESGQNPELDFIRMVDEGVAVAYVTYQGNLWANGFFDGVGSLLSGKLSCNWAQINNIDIGGTANTIASYNTNGDINIAPNGTGDTNISNGNLQFGGTDAIDDGRNATLATMTLSAQPVCDAYETSTQSIPTGTPYTAVTFGNETQDVGDFHSTVSNTSRFTVPSDGRYLFHYFVSFASNATGSREAFFGINGSTTTKYGLDRRFGNASYDTNLGKPWQWTLSGGDYVELFVFQDTGSNLNVNGTGGRTAWVSVTKLH